MSYRPSAETSAYLRLGHHVQDQHIGYQYGRNLQKSPALAAGLSTGLGTWGRLDGSLWAQSVRFTKENGAS